MEQATIFKLCKIISNLLNNLEYTRWPRLSQPRTSRQCCRSQHSLSLHFNATLLATDVAAMGAGRLLPSTPALLALPSPFLDQNLDRMGAFGFIPGTHHVHLHPCTHSAFYLDASMYPYIRSISRCTILPTPHPSSSNYRRPLPVTTPSIKRQTGALHVRTVLWVRVAGPCLPARRLPRTVGGGCYRGLSVPCEGRNWQSTGSYIHGMQGWQDCGLRHRRERQLIQIVST